jgi:hypothetical protein
VTKSAQADTQRVRERRVFYRWLWLVDAPIGLGVIALMVFLSGVMPGFLALPFMALLIWDAICVRLLVERHRRKIPLHVPPTLVIGVGATVAAVLVGVVLAWMGVDRLSSKSGPALLVLGGFLILTAAFAPAFKVLDLVLRVTGRGLLHLGGQKSHRRPQPARRPPQGRPRKAA